MRTLHGIPIPALACALLAAALAGCSSQQQFAMARISNDQAHAAAVRADAAVVTPTLAEGAAALAESDSLLAKSERGDYGPFAQGDRLQDAYVQGELAAAAFLKAGAEQDRAAAQAELDGAQAGLENDRKTLEDYESLLKSLKNGGAE